MSSHSYNSDYYPHYPGLSPRNDGTQPASYTVAPVTPGHPATSPSHSRHSSDSSGGLIFNMDSFNGGPHHSRGVEQPPMHGRRDTNTNYSGEQPTILPDPHRVCDRCGHPYATVDATYHWINCPARQSPAGRALPAHGAYSARSPGSTPYSQQTPNSSYYYNNVSSNNAPTPSQVLSSPPAHDPQPYGAHSDTTHGGTRYLVPQGFTPAHPPSGQFYVHPSNRSGRAPPPSHSSPELPRQHQPRDENSGRFWTRK